MNVRINNIPDLSDLLIPEDETRVNVYIPYVVVSIQDHAEGKYDALWVAVCDHLKAKGWKWNGLSGIEADGSGEWMAFYPVGA